MKENKMLVAFVAIFAIFAGVVFLVNDVDSSDAGTGTASMSLVQGETKTYTWAEAFDDITGDYVNHTYSIGVAKSPTQPSDGSTVSGITITYSSTGITITVGSSVSTGTYNVNAYDWTTEDDVSSTTFAVTSASSGGSSQQDIEFTSTAPTQGISGSTYNYTPTTNVPATFSKSGTWPSWLSLNTSTGKVSGTMPTVSSSQTYSVTIHAVSNTLSSNTADQTITIHVYPIAQITASNGTTIAGITGTSLSKSLSCNLSGTTFAVKSGSNALPTGLSISSAGVISGTPSQAVSNRSVTIEGTTTTGPVQYPTIVLTFNIQQAEDTLQITSNAMNLNKSVGQSVDHSLASNVTGTIFVLSNAPSWLAIDGNNHIRGTVPTTYSSATTLTFTVTATTPQGQTATQTETLNVEPVLKFTSKPTAAAIAIPHYIYADDGTVDAGIIDDLRDGFNSATSKKCSAYTFVFVGENASAVSWDFGDGTVFEPTSEDNGFSVYHEYTKAGTYIVTCTATNEYENDQGQTVTGTDECTLDVTVDADASDYIYTMVIILLAVIVLALVLKTIFKAKGTGRRH